MKAVEKKLLEEIDKMLENSNTFPAKYNRQIHTIEPDLLEELMFFCNRAKFVGETLNRKGFIGIMNNFLFSHASDVHKSQIENFEADLTIIKTHLKLFKSEIEQGYIFTIAELMRAEVFGDFLEIGKHLFDKAYYVAAAVIIGTVLENKVRELSAKNNLSTKDGNNKWLALETMNVALCQAGIYKLGVQQLITAHYNTRNNAAHGHYQLVTKKDVKNLYDFVTDFDNQIQ